MKYQDMQGKIKNYGLPLLDVSQVSASGGDAGAAFEPGTIVAVRNGANWSLATYVQVGNTVISQGEVAVPNFATLAQFRVGQSATAADHGAPMKGIACGTIGSLKFGWIYIWGYVEKADLSHTAASGEYLLVSGSIAGKLSPDKASVFNAGTFGSSSAFMVVAVARTAIATGIGSVSIVGMWG
jgi:hypothetical protein